MMNVSYNKRRKLTLAHEYETTSSKQETAAADILLRLFHHQPRKRSLDCDLQSRESACQVAASPAAAIIATSNPIDTFEPIANEDSSSDWKNERDEEVANVEFEQLDDLPMAAAKDEEQLFVVESIGDERKVDGNSEFLVRWAGHSFEEDTWEPLEGVQHLDALLDFQARRALKKDDACKDHAFETVEQLRTRDHTGEKRKPHKCKFEGCNAAFKTSSSLKRHHRIHTKEKPFKCKVDGCNAVFNTSSNLKAHHRIHTKEKPFKCKVDGCNAAFSQSSNLKAHHRRIHIKEKSFKCKVDGCNAAFAQAGDLKAHHRIHTKEKPFKCKVDGCNAAFAQAGNLKRHHRIHRGADLY